MKPLSSDGQEQIANMNKVNLVAYMKRLGHIPTFVDDQITVFALQANSAGETIITINNTLNWLESVTTIVEGNILDLASLVFKVTREQILADPATYGLEEVYVQENRKVLSDPSTS